MRSGSTTIIIAALTAMLSSSSAMAEWKLRNLNIFAKRDARGQLKPDRKVARQRVEANIAASKAARESSRFGKPVQNRRTKPFKVQGPDTVLRSGYTLATNLTVGPYGTVGWDSPTLKVQIDTDSKPIKRFRRAAARLRGKNLELNAIVGQLEDLIQKPQGRSGNGLRLLGLERLSSTSERGKVRGTGQDGVHKLSDFVRHGQASNLEALLLMQVGLQAAGVQSKLVAGKLTWRRDVDWKTPMWIEVSRGPRTPEVITTLFGRVDLLSRQANAKREPATAGTALTLTR